MIMLNASNHKLLRVGSSTNDSHLCFTIF